MPFLKKNPKETRSQRIEKASSRNGIRHAIFSTDGKKYVGEWKDNKKSGKGTLTMKSGVVYEGNWVNNRAHGFGVMAYPESSGDKTLHLCYRGQFVNGKQHSGGVYHRSDGTYYNGEWKKGKRDGYGLLWYANGDFYAGYFHKGKRHGLGMFVVTNGNRYEGEWREGLKHGRGRYYHLQKGTLQEGIWVNGNCAFSEIKIIPYRQCAMLPMDYPIWEEIAVKGFEKILRHREAKALVEETMSCSSSHTTVDKEDSDTEEEK